MVAPVPEETVEADSGIGRLLIALLVLGLTSLAIAGVAAAWVTARNQYHTEWVSHTYRVELAIADVRRLIEQGETTRRGYMLAPQDSFLTAYRQTRAELPVASAGLVRLVHDNPVERANIASLDRQITELTRLRDNSVALVGADRRDAAITAFRGEVGASRMRRIRGTLDAMAAEEHRLLRLRDAEQRSSVRTFYIVLGVMGALLLVVAITTLITVSRYTRDLGRSRDVLRALAGSLEDQVQERTGDLVRANEEIQRFAYIVSHDLRSPLVNVMGFTAELEAANQALGELVDRAEQEAPSIVTDEARAAAREDLPESIGFIRTSTQKMDRLINAILKLSREGRRVIAPQQLDVAAIVEGVRGSLAHRLDEDGTDVIVESPLPPVVSDRLAVEQILSNLIENAVKYSHPDRAGRIVVRGATTATHVVYEVEDNGRGIDPRDHTRVFDLFRRSGTQDQPGEGIGLAHVRALAYRLGGNVDMRSELGQGATFRLTLPKAFAEPQDHRK